MVSTKDRWVLEITTERVFSLVGDIDHALCVRISKVGLVRWPDMDLILIKGVFDLVWEYTGRQARDELDNLGFVRGVEDVVVHKRIVSQEGELILHIFEQASNWESTMQTPLGIDQASIALQTHQGRRDG